MSKKVLVLWKASEVHYTVVARLNEDGEVKEFVCAYGYDEKDQSWAQGHYFNSLPAAMSYMLSVYEKESHNLIKE